MRLLILGASGQIGGHLLSQALAAGHAAAGTSLTCPREGLIPLDIEDRPGLRAAFRDLRPEGVVLSAGWTWVDGNEDDPSASRARNRDGPLYVAERCRELGALFVTYSTDYVFDGERGPYHLFGAVRVAHAQPGLPPPDRLRLLRRRCRWRLLRKRPPGRDHPGKDQQ